MTDDGSGGASRVLVIGDVIDDLIVRPHGPIARDTDTTATIVPHAGGSGANQAAWLAHAGAHVRFVGRVGTDDVTRHARALTRHGVEAHLVADDRRPTGTIVVLVETDGSRTMLTDRGANLGLAHGELPDALLDDVALVHVSGYALFDASVRGAVLDLVGRAVARAIPWSVDPASTGFLAEVGVDAFLTWTRGVDVLLPNLDEGRMLAAGLVRRSASGADADEGLDAEPDAVATTLTLHAPVVAMTLGAGGAIVARRGATSVAVPADDVKVVDTTGAGDAFAGGFLAALVAGTDLRGAASAGIHLSSRAVGRLGARPQDRSAVAGDREED